MEFTTYHIYRGKKHIDDFVVSSDLSRAEALEQFYETARDAYPFSVRLVRVRATSHRSRR
jgi:hypothetical protein